MLLANSKQALLDFANIQTTEDIASFNQQYDVNLSMPSGAQMEPFKKNKIILNAEDVKNTLTSSLQETLTKQKKPVKFSWEGLKNFSKVFTTNPFDKMRNERLMELMDNKDKPKEKDYIDFFEDMEKSIYGAVQNIGYSFGDLITTGIDAAADTNLTERLDKIYDESKIDDPETLLGTVNKVLIEYGLPGGAVFKVMNRAKKLIKAKKVKGDNETIKYFESALINNSFNRKNIEKMLAQVLICFIFIL